MPAYKYTLKSGKTQWYANFYYTDWTGQKRHVCKRGFRTQREAKEYERGFKTQREASSDITFPALVENYLEDMGHRLKPTTMENKRFVIEGKILPYFSRLRACDIDSIKVRRWQNELIAYRDEKGRPYSQTYLKAMNNQLSAIMNYAVRHYGLPSNPCLAAGSMGKGKAGEMRVWTREEYERFAGEVRSQPMRLAFDILFYTGIRSGELLALTPADVLPDGRLSVTKTYARVRGEEMFLEPKTPKGRRTLAIPDFLREEIEGYVSGIYGIRPDDRIFHYTKSSLEKEMKRAAPRAGLEPIRVHDLRHSHASMLIDMGIDILEISERLGHESARTTLDTYAHLYPDKDARLAEELNKLRRPGADVADPKAKEGK